MAFLLLHDNMELEEEQEYDKKTTDINIFLKILVDKPAKEPDNRSSTDYEQSCWMEGDQVVWQVWGTKGIHIDIDNCSGGAYRSGGAWRVVGYYQKQNPTTQAL